jgi:hypothetical protein
VSNIHHDLRPGTMIDEDELEGGVTSAGQSIAKLCRLPPALTHTHTNTHTHTHSWTRGKTNHIRSSKNVQHECRLVPISLRLVSKSRAPIFHQSNYETEDVSHKIVLYEEFKPKIAKKQVI